jgi:hypothetical protein
MMAKVEEENQNPKLMYSLLAHKFGYKISNICHKNISIDSYSKDVSSGIFFV